MKSRPQLSSVLLIGLATAALGLLSCDAVGPSPSGKETVEVGFTTVSPSASTRSTGSTAKRAADSLVLSGPNGTLKINDIRLIVSEFTLEGEADSVDFEASPSFLDLPLDTTKVAPVATGALPAGRYTEFEFNVENVDLGDTEEDDDENQLRALRDTIHQVFPHWPAEASMVTVGTFTPAGDTARSFTTYFEAEVEVERELRPPLEVSEAGTSRRLTVKLDPSQWFVTSSGTVRNLSQFDYASTGELVELEFEEGVVEIESEDQGED